MTWVPDPDEPARLRRTVQDTPLARLADIDVVERVRKQLSWAGHSEPGLAEAVLSVAALQAQPADPDPVLLCRRLPCRGATYRDQETHDFLHHGGYPPPTGMDPLDVTTHADYTSDPVRLAAGAYDVIHHREHEQEAFASARAVAIVIVVLLALVFVVTIVLVSGRPPQ